MSYIISPDIPDNLLESYLSESEIAVDTELHGLRLYRDEVCLIQLCDDKNNVSLIKPENDQTPPNLKRLFTDQSVQKIFHFAITDVAFIKTSLNIEVKPFCCTKVMSKLVRTYTQDHGLKDLILELHGKHINKEQQQTNWGDSNLTQEQLEYAANDVIYLHKIKNELEKMLVREKRMEIFKKCLIFLDTRVELDQNGFKFDIFEH